MPSDTPERTPEERAAEAEAALIVWGFICAIIILAVVAGLIWGPS